MTSIIKLQTFSGELGEGPHCYLLQVDEFHFLLDCGWDESFNTDYIEGIKKHIGQIDAVLCTYPDVLHIGALPYLVGKCGLSCPIYATIPVYKMGQMFMYDLYQSHHNTEDFDIFTLDDVDAAFDKILQLKYSQTVGLKGRGHGLQITPLPAGHMIGGTIWKIVKDGEEEIVYAVDYNHKKERHLNGCVLDGLTRPHLLITDAFNANYTQARRRLRDEQLMTNILMTMRNDGNVLIAVDTAGRVLELAHLLDQMWRTQESGLMAYSLALLNNVSYNVVEFAKSQVEWMSDKIMKAFEDRRNNPFQFRHLQLCHSLAELNRVPEPKVVLASVPDMQCGFSRELFLQWCGNPKNTIVLTNRTTPGTLTRWLIENPNLNTLVLKVHHRVRLEGEELEEHLRIQREKEAQEAKVKAERERKEREELESSSESEEEQEDTTIRTKHDLMMASESKQRVGFFKQAKKSYAMFPVREEKLKWDDYGEIIRPDDYIILEPVQQQEEKMDTGDTEEAHGQEIIDVPTKCITTEEKVDILANVIFIDFEGRSDGESIRKILSQIRPRQLILVRGSKEASQSLADYCRSNRDLVQGKIHIPGPNELIDATTESHIYQVRLRDSVVSALKFYKAKEYDVAWIDATLDLSKTKTDTSAKKDVAGKTDHNQDRTDQSDQDMIDEETADVIPTLVPCTGPVEGHKAVFINEPKLSDFKQILIKENIQAEFSGGVLICNNVVAVRRNEAGRLQLEGCLCDDYYKVRSLLYEQFAIV